MFCTNAWALFTQGPIWALRSIAGRRTVTFLRHREALGDSLMVTALARGLKKAFPELRVAVASRRPELFAHNPHLGESRGWHLWRTRYTVQAGYNREELAGRGAGVALEHVVQIQWRALWNELARGGFFEQAGSEVPAAPVTDGVHPELFLTEAERARGRELAGKGAAGGKPVVLIGGGGKLKPTHNREWGYANYQALVDLLAPHVRLLQVSGDEPLRVAGRPLPALGSLPPREAAALMACSDAVLVQEGGLMHLARAVNAPTVVIYGGYVLPEQTGYAEQVNLWARPECSPCIAGAQNCPHLKCMVEITPRRVLGCLAELLEKGSGYRLPAEVLGNAPQRWEPPPFVDRGILEAELAQRG